MQKYTIQEDEKFIHAKKNQAIMTWTAPCQGLVQEGLPHTNRVFYLLKSHAITEIKMYEYNTYKCITI